jgi:hypothetical protein
MKGKANLLPVRGEKWARVLRFEGHTRRKRGATLLIWL